MNFNENIDRESCFLTNMASNKLIARKVSQNLKF